MSVRDLGAERPSVSPESTVAAPGWGRSPKAIRRLRHSGVQLASLAVFLVLWQLLGAVTSPVLFATPIRVIGALFDLLYKGQLQAAFVIAAADLLVGYGLAIVVGLALGIAMGRSALIERVLDPYVNFMQATPVVAFIPLLVIWFGIGFESRVAAVFIFAVWSVIINTATGVKGTPRILADVARVYHVREHRVMRLIAVPYAVPLIFAGLRIALGKALIGMVIAEMEVTVVGIGGLISSYGQSFRTAYLLAAIMAASLVGVITAVALSWLLARFFPWVAATSAERE